MKKNVQPYTQWLCSCPYAWCIWRRERLLLKLTRARAPQWFGHSKTHWTVTVCLMLQYVTTVTTSESSYISTPVVPGMIISRASARWGRARPATVRRGRTTSVGAPKCDHHWQDRDWPSLISHLNDLARSYYILEINNIYIYIYYNKEKVYVYTLYNYIYIFIIL